MKITGKLMIVTVLIVGLSSSVLAESITVKGSTTVLPIAQACAEEFMDMNSDINISVQGGGSGFGIASIMDSTADIGDASRPAKDKELRKAAAKGIDLKANVVAMDGIAVVVNNANPIDALNKKQVKDIYTGKVTDWSQIGGASGKIVAVSRDSSSGTYETFLKLALDKERVSPSALRQASNQAVATTIAKTPGAIGYVGLGYLSSRIKAVEINGVEPSKETVLSGEYILSRPLFMYTQGKPKGLVKEFLDFVLSDTGQRIAEKQGYVGLK